MLTITEAWLRLGAISALLLGVSACSAESSAPVPEAPGTFLYDHTWQCDATTLLTTGAENVPFPAPNVLAGALARFGADGRMLVAAPGAGDFEDLGSRYSVTDGASVRLRLDRGPWFPFEYHFDRVAGILLLNPEPMAADAVTGFVRDVTARIFATGAPDGPAAAFTDRLYRDERVAGAVERFLWTAVHGDEGTSVPAAEGTASALYAVLAPSGVFEPALDEDAVVEELVPIVRVLASLESGKLTNRVVSELLDSEAVDATLMLESAERTIRYALYQAVLTTRENLAAVEHVELELSTAD